MEELEIQPDETLRLWDFDPTLISLTSFHAYNRIGDIPILVEEGMSIDPGRNPARRVRG